MGCTRHFLSAEWEHHSWRRRVTSAEAGSDGQSNMWGRRVNADYVRCHKQQVCEVCGKTRPEVSCFCAKSYAEHCPIYREWLDESLRDAHRA